MFFLAVRGHLHSLVHSTTSLWPLLYHHIFFSPSAFFVILPSLILTILPLSYSDLCDYSQSTRQYRITSPLKGFPGGSDAKASACNAGDQVDPWVRKIPWRRKWQPTSVLLPGKFYRWRRLGEHSPWGCKESYMTEWLHFHEKIFSWSLLFSMLVTNLYLPCVPTDHSPSRSFVHGVLRQEEWSGLPCPPPGDILDSGIELSFSVLAVLYH